MFYIYVLQSQKTRRFYMGLSGDPKLRIDQHNSGINPFTKEERPWRAVYMEGCPSKDVAVRRQEFLKSSKGRAFLKQQLQKPKEGLVG